MYVESLVHVPETIPQGRTEKPHQGQEPGGAVTICKTLIRTLFHKMLERDSCRPVEGNPSIVGHVCGTVPSGHE